MTIEEKLTILTDAAKYDVACTSSGGDRRGGAIGKTIAGGCCHSFSADGRCITLLKVLLTARLGRLADRLSVNIELPSARSLALLAPDKKKDDIFRPMAQIQEGILQTKADKVKYRHTPDFAPAGQSTQMIVGASDETDYHILKLSEGMYRKYGLKRVFFSAYVPVATSPLLPSPLEFQPPLLREHRLYQSDWLLRFYRFTADEILSPDNPTLNPDLDPKCNWAMNHLEFFPVEVNTADYAALLRVPGIGVTGARRILSARRWRALDETALKKLGIVMKRAQYFITCSGRPTPALRMRPEGVLRALTALEAPVLAPQYEQLSLFSS